MAAGKPPAGGMYRCSAGAPPRGSGRAAKGCLDCGDDGAVVLEGGVDNNREIGGSLGVGADIARAHEVEESILPQIPPGQRVIADTERAARPRARRIAAMRASCSIAASSWIGTRAR